MGCDGPNSEGLRLVLTDNTTSHVDDKQHKRETQFWPPPAARLHDDVSLGVEHGPHLRHTSRKESVMMASTLTATPITATLIRGAAELEQTESGLLPHRLPPWARAQSEDPQLAMVESQPSGVRLVFRTAATTIELDVRRSRVAYAGVPSRPAGVIDLIIDGIPSAEAPTSGGTTITVDMATGERAIEAGPVSTASFDTLSARMKTVELWLPHNETIELIELRADAPIEPGPETTRPVWVHHGSSISQGSNAIRPSGTWPAVAARLADVELVNLGFGGSSLLDPFIARVIRDTPADVISLKLGINLVNTDLMRMRAFGPAVHGLLDTIREGQPTTPIVVISPIYCGIHENTPGPVTFDLDALANGAIRFRATGTAAERATGKLTLTSIRDELARIVSFRQASDPHLSYIDGLDLYGEVDSGQHPLPDALHPDPTSHKVMGERFAGRLTHYGHGRGVRL